MELRKQGIQPQVPTPKVQSKRAARSEKRAYQQPSPRRYEPNEVL
jgi:hypothetical protein